MVCASCTHDQPDNPAHKNMHALLQTTGTKVHKLNITSNKPGSSHSRRLHAREVQLYLHVHPLLWLVFKAGLASSACMDMMHLGRSRYKHTSPPMHMHICHGPACKLHHGCMLPGPHQCALGPRQTCHASASLRTTVLLTTRQERCFATHCHKQGHKHTQREVYLYCARAACTTHCHAVSTAAFNTLCSLLLRTHSSTSLLNHKSHTVSCAEWQRYMHHQITVQKVYHNGVLVVNTKPSTTHTARKPAQHVG